MSATKATMKLADKAIDFTLTDDGQVIDNATGEIVVFDDFYRFTGRAFAIRWLTVASAATKDPEQFQLYRSVNVERGDDGVRLTATDSYRVWTWWLGAVGKDIDFEPEFTATPERSVTLSDSEFRLRDLCRWVVKRTKKDEDPPLTVTLSIGKAPRAEGQLIGMERQAAQVAVSTTTTGLIHEVVTVPILEMDYPNLHPLFLEHTPDPTDIVWFPPTLLAKMVKAFPFDSTAPVRFYFSGPNGAVLVLPSLPPDVPPLRGLLMPARRRRSDDD